MARHGSARPVPVLRGAGFRCPARRGAARLGTALRGALRAQRSRSVRRGEAAGGRRMMMRQKWEREEGGAQPAGRGGRAAPHRQRPQQAGRALLGRASSPRSAFLTPSVFLTPPGLVSAPSAFLTPRPAPPDAPPGSPRWLRSEGTASGMLRVGVLGRTGVWWWHAAGDEFLPASKEPKIHRGE